jgi:FtsH-binding integral membrane protein
MSGWEQRIVTGNPQADQATVEQHRQAAAAQGLAFDAQPLPTGGFYVRAYPPQGGPPLGGYGQPPQQPWGGGAPAYASAGGMTFQSVSGSAGGVVVGGGTAAPALTNERVQYLRKVYGLLFAAVLVAGFGGFAALNFGGTMRIPGTRVLAPTLVAILMTSRATMWVAFGVLFVATLAASAVSKVRGLNVVALFGVATILGVELAPMMFLAQYMAGLGKTMTAAPVTGAFLVTAAAFAGATSYVFITRKDFSYLKATLAMGFWVVFAGCIAAVFISNEVFTLAICSVGAIVAVGMILMQTSRIFRESAMDDAVGDCLVLLVQLRNLFMFILRILMSSRR